MTLNVAVLTGRLAAGAGIDLNQAGLVIGEALDLINTVEQVYVDLKGDQKFQAVMAGVRTLITELGLDDELAAIERVLGPLVSVVVTIYNLAKLWPFQQKAPAPVAPTPATVGGTTSS